MKYCVVITDGAAGLPLAEYGGRTSLEVAVTPHLDALAGQGTLGLVRTVPPGLEPSSAVACMSVLGYDPVRYYRGRAAIEALSMGIPVAADEAVFRCNLVSLKDGRMWDYSGDHIGSGEAAELIGALNDALGTDAVTFYPGIGYRHILKLKGSPETLHAVCTPAHDITDLEIAPYLPQGEGSALLLELMQRSAAVFADHPVNRARVTRGAKPVNSIWLCWGTGELPQVPSFKARYGLRAGLSSPVDLLRGLALQTGIEVVDIAGVSDGPDNDYAAQAVGCLEALADRDLVVIHIEAPDECGHGGDAAAKIGAIEAIDREVIGRLRDWRGDRLRLLIQPDHPTPLALRTHTAEPVPFMLWGDGLGSNGAARFTEAEAAGTGLFMENGYNVMGLFTGEAKI
jgi:2,3-bisphosphoglycerate-independent phosphoglycerate mutase